MRPPALSIVIPVHNEQGNLAPLDRELKNVLERLGRTYEVIYVDDGSTDDSLKELKAVSRITIIELNKNYGQAVALDAGFKAAEGELIISLDADGQNDPADIPKLIEKLESSACDIVAGWRQNRQDKRNVVFITLAARMLRRFFIGDIVHDSGCTLRVYRRKAAKSLDIGGEMHRYILALLKWNGFRIEEMAVNHRPRLNGASKYGASKAFRGFIDLVYIWFIHKYSQRPLHLFGYLSFGALALGTIAGVWAVWGKFVLGLSLNRNGWFFITFFFLLAGVIFFSFGIVIDLLMQIRFSTSKSEARYHVREVIRT